jgi:hypothetical protein
LFERDGEHGIGIRLGFGDRFHADETNTAILLTQPRPRLTLESSPQPTRPR